MAPRIAAADPQIAGIVVMAGAARPLLEIAREQIAYLASMAPAATAASQEEALATLRRAAPESYWADLDAYKPAGVASSLTLPMLFLQGDRDYQVTPDNLRVWRAALDGHASVAFRTYSTLNHLFMPGEGPGTPAEYMRAGHIPETVIDDIAGWLKSGSLP